MEPKECECNKRKSHTSKKLHMIYVSSNNIRHPVDGFGGLVVSMLWHPSLRVQTRPKPLDFYGRKNP